MAKDGKKAPDGENIVGKGTAGEVGKQALIDSLKKIITKLKINSLSVSEWM